LKVSTLLAVRLLNSTSGKLAIICYNYSLVIFLDIIIVCLMALGAKLTLPNAIGKPG